MGMEELSIDIIYDPVSFPWTVPLSRENSLNTTPISFPHKKVHLRTQCCRHCRVDQANML
jgi:hypothetical protein